MPEGEANLHQGEGQEAQIAKVLLPCISVQAESLRPGDVEQKATVNTVTERNMLISGTRSARKASHCRLVSFPIKAVSKETGEMRPTQRNIIAFDNRGFPDQGT